MRCGGNYDSSRGKVTFTKRSYWKRGRRVAERVWSVKRGKKNGKKRVRKGEDEAES